MSEYNKQRFYWIKLTDRFMTSDTVDFLMEQKDGANYVVLYQMLCLKTINQNGELARTLGEIIVPYDAEKIQRDTKWFSIDTVRVALDIYKRLGLIYEQDNGVLKITDFDKLIGSQTISAFKKQAQLESRGGKKVEKIPPEKDKDKEKEKEIDKDIEEIKENSILTYTTKESETENGVKGEKKPKNDTKTDQVIEVLNYLNSKVGTHYKPVECNARLIRARLKDYTIDEIKTVIDRKHKEWYGTKMQMYLRPETLFSATKFESYLNNTKIRTYGKNGVEILIDTEEEDEFEKLGIL